MSGTNKDSFNGSNAAAEAIREIAIKAFVTEQAGAAVQVSFSSASGLPPVTTGYGEALIQTQPTGLVALPASYPVLTDLIGAPVTVVGGGGPNQAAVAFSGGLTLDFNDGGGVAYTAANPADGVAPTGNTIFLAGVGPAVVAAGEGQDTIVASSGSNFIAAGGGSNVVFLEGGNNYVATEGNDQIVGGIGIGIGSVAAAGNATVSLSGNSTVFGGAGKMLLLNGAGTSFLVPQTDSTTGALTSTGSVTLFGGQGGGAFFGGSDGGNVMMAGQQATTLVGGGVGDVLFASGAANDVLQAVGGNTTLVGTGASGNNEFFGGPGSTAMYGGTGSDIYIAGTGNDIMSAGSGADQFDFTAGQAGGVDAIFGFKPGIDQVNLFGYDNGDGSAAANALVQAAANVSGGTTFVVLGDNTTIFFVGTPVLTNTSIVG
jgi:Ca2+-binding RTX toxin-like protein